ncbi:MAG: hypothetical protein LBL92_03790 [Propionibacteriaceae bacterium]|jgi:hypothetical protein|nr:hypothetical protein [Propionibacteriaceae bacterium]
MADYSDPIVAADAVTQPSLSAVDLRAIAYYHPDLRVAVAQHPAAFPGLLDWLETHGDEAVKVAVEQRRADDPTLVTAPVDSDSVGQTPHGTENPPPGSKSETAAETPTSNRPDDTVILPQHMAASAGPPVMPQVPPQARSPYPGQPIPQVPAMAGQYGPQPSYPAAPPAQRSSQTKLLIILVAVLGGIVVIGGITLAVPPLIDRFSPTDEPTMTASSPAQTTSSSPSPVNSTAVPSIPPETAALQVRRLADLLTASAAARGQLVPAVSSVSNCLNLDRQIETIAAITQNRRDLLAVLATTPVDQISNGTTLTAQLRSALEASLGSDENYLAWAQAVRASGCATGAGSTYYATAGGFDRQASAAKAVFVSTWNSTIAPVYGVSTFSESQI